MGMAWKVNPAFFFLSCYCLWHWAKSFRPIANLIIWEQGFYSLLKWCEKTFGAENKYYTPLIKGCLFPLVKQIKNKNALITLSPYQDHPCGTWSVGKSMLSYQLLTLMKLLPGHQALPFGRKKNNSLFAPFCLSHSLLLPNWIYWLYLGLPTCFMCGRDCVALKTKQPQVQLSAKGGNRLQTSPLLFCNSPLNEKHNFWQLDSAAKL